MATRAKKSRGKSRSAKRSGSKSRGGRAASAKAPKKSAKMKRGTSAKKKAAPKKAAKRTTVKRTTVKRTTVKRATAKRSTPRRSPLARVKQVAQEVVQQATTAVTEGVETLKDLGETSSIELRLERSAIGTRGSRVRFHERRESRDHRITAKVNRDDVTCAGHPLE